MSSPFSLFQRSGERPKNYRPVFKMEIKFFQPRMNSPPKSPFDPCSWDWLECSCSRFILLCFLSIFFCLPAALPDFDPSSSCWNNSETLCGLFSDLNEQLFWSFSGRGAVIRGGWLVHGPPDRPDRNQWSQGIYHFCFTSIVTLQKIMFLKLFYKGLGI